MENISFASRSGRMVLAPRRGKWRCVIRVTKVASRTLELKQRLTRAEEGYLRDCIRTSQPRSYHVWPSSSTPSLQVIFRPIRLPIALTYAENSTIIHYPPLPLPTYLQRYSEPTIRGLTATPMHTRFTLHVSLFFQIGSWVHSPRLKTL